MLVPLFALFSLLQDAIAVRLEAPVSAPNGFEPWPEKLRKIYPVWYAAKPELLEEGFTYSKPPGSGCDINYKPPEPLSPFSPFNLVKDNRVASMVRDMTVPKTALSVLRIKPDGSPAWNGFCQMQWPSCPDAVANRDYYYYAKSLGPEWIKVAGYSDKMYCHNAGFLKPEIARITRNFTALQAKGVELCLTEFSDPKYGADRMQIMEGPFKSHLTGTLHRMREFAIKGSEIAENENTFQAAKDLLQLWNSIEEMDEFASKATAAWNCALGDLSCDIAYCNYAFCEKPDGSVGVADECEGWDPIYGLPGTWPNGEFPKKH